jgi:hypothetical protein
MFCPVLKFKEKRAFAKVEEVNVDFSPFRIHRRQLIQLGARTAFGPTRPIPRQLNVKY